MSSALINGALQILAKNDRGEWTVPAHDLYPHQWLWDSCFIAIGLRHHDPQRAATEVKSLLRGQWSNGMIPHITLTEPSNYWAGPEFWRSSISPNAPDGIATSGITQPPLPAIAALAVAEKLSEDEAQVFIKQVYPAILRYHQWLYTERDPDATGLIVLVHPWETGLDNTPPWMELLRSLSPLWITAMLRLRVDAFVNKVRVDTKNIPMTQRLTSSEAMKLLHLGFQLRKQKYDNRKIINSSKFCVESLVFNSILIRANQALEKMAARIAEQVPADLTYRFAQTEQAMERLWDEETGQYYPRRYHDKRLIKVPSIATFLPLYAGTIPPERAAALRRLLKDTKKYWSKFPVPTAALDSSWYDEDRYWQGPTWLSTNWMIIEGLKHYGFVEDALSLTKTCVELVKQSGYYEYYSALSGKGFGSSNFSWTAAILLDLLERPRRPVVAANGLKTNAPSA